MWLDAMILALIAALAWSGARAGAAVAGVRLVSLPLAYAAALGAAWAFGPALAREAAWPDSGGALVAGSIALLGIQLVLGAVARAVASEDAPGAGSQAAGAVLGALRGALFALPLLWLAGLAEGARVAGVRPELPDLSAARLPAFGGEVLAVGARPVVDAKTPSGRFVLGVVANPAETLEGIQHVVQDPRVVTLQGDPGFWQDVERGAVARALGRPAARRLVNDRAFRGRLAKLGVVSDEAAKNASRFESELSAALAEIGPRLAAVRSDPAFAALLSDPAVRTQLERGNTLTLFQDARFRALVSRATR